MGDAMSRLEINDELSIAFSENYKETEDGVEFFKGHIDPDYRGQTAKLAKFVSAALSRMKPPYSVREKTVPQSVPENWFTLANETCGPGGIIFETFNEAGVTVVVAADQSFFQFHNQSKKVVVPRGTKRVGGKVKADEKVSAFDMPLTSHAPHLIPPCPGWMHSHGVSLLGDEQRRGSRSSLA